MDIPVCCLLSGLTTGGEEEVFGTAPLVVAVGVLELVVVAFMVVASAVVVALAVVVVSAAVVVAMVVVSAAIVVVVGASHCWVFYQERK